MRFRPEQHLRRQTDIRAVREQGRRVDCRAFTVWWRQRPDDSVPPVSPATPRVCVAASIAAVGAAVQRNRAKRRLREIFRRHQGLVPAGCDLLLVARGAVNGRPFAELEQVFVEALRPDLLDSRASLTMADRRKIADLPAALLLALIRLYQFAFSPLLRMAAGPGCGCRFHPHCSAYALDAVRAHGAVRGSWLAAVRLARCHPGSAGGWDPAPPAENRWRCVRTVS